MDEKRLRRWLDQEMNAAESDAFLSSLSEQERKVARALAAVADAAARLPTTASPEDFVARTMSRVRTRRPPRRTIWSWLRAPTLSPLAAFAGAAAVALCVFGATQWYPRVGLHPGSAEQAQLAAPTRAQVVARLTYRAPLARQVAVAGDFNGWEPQAARMRRGPGGVWSVEIPLAPGGRYQYMLVVDGQWVTDPGASATLDDGFGGKNALLEL
jgi:hypothetical protein